jgi:hypothetical protein
MPEVTKGGMQFLSSNANDLWGRAKQEPDWRPLDATQASDIIVHRKTGQKMRRDHIKGWVGLKRV